MRESMTDAQILHEWNSNYLLRSSQGQRILMDAARYRMAQRGLRQKIDRTAPVVQRPGSPAEIAPPGDYEYAKLSEKLDRSTGREALKAAADLVTARRLRRRSANLHTNPWTNSLVNGKTTLAVGMPIASGFSTTRQSSGSLT